MPVLEFKLQKTVRLTVFRSFTREWVGNNELRKALVMLVVIMNDCAINS